MKVNEFKKIVIGDRKKYLSEFLSVYKINNNILKDEIKIFETYCYLKENVVSGDITGVTPAIGTSPVYPVRFLNKKPVYKVDTKTVSYFNSKTSKDFKKSWEKFLKCVHESIDLKMKIMDLRKLKENFYITDGKTIVEFKNIDSEFSKEELLKLKKDVEKELNRVVDGYVEIEGLSRFGDSITIEMEESDIFKLYYFIHDLFSGVSIFNNGRGLGFYFNKNIDSDAIAEHIDKKFKKLGL